jgi:hypothetical protein
VGRGLVVRLAGVFLALSSSGCVSSSAPESNGGATAQPRLGASVLQFRQDYQPRRIQIRVANNGTEAVTLTSARLRSAGFSQDAVWAGGPAVLAPGLQIDLPTLLPPSACRAGSDTVPAVVVQFRVGSGSGHSATLDVQDPFGSLERVHRDDCLQQIALAITSMSLGEPLRTTRIGGALVALLDLRLTPTGAPGTVTVLSVSGTTLLAPGQGPTWLVGVDVSGGTGAQTVTLTARPNRCDPHAVAEDKIGTVLPVTVRIGDRVGIVTVAASRTLKGQIYDYVDAACR